MHLMSYMKTENPRLLLSFVDHGMTMRFHWGMAIGHAPTRTRLGAYLQYQLHSRTTPLLNPLGGRVAFWNRQNGSTKLRVAPSPAMALENPWTLTRLNWKTEHGMQKRCGLPGKLIPKIRHTSEAWTRKKRMGTLKSDALVNAWCQ